MNIKKYSTKGILAKIFNDFQPSNSAWIASCYDWIGEAVQAIGFHANSETKIAEVCIVNHRGNFPCDIEGLIAVYHNNYRLPMGSDVSGYGIVNWHKDTPKDLDNQDVVNLDKLIVLLTTQQNDYIILIDSGVLPTDPQAIAQEELIKTTSAKITNIAANFTLATPTQYKGLDYYNVNKNQIITSVEEATFRIVYWAFPTDEDGFPEILDTFKYKEAVEWYCMYKMMLKGYNHAQLKWTDAFQMFEKYRQQASNEAKMVGQDDMERFKNMWTNPNFNRDLWQNGFIFGEQQTGYIR
tara:strand:- start:519 stop:1406 length:888 start_codon:yes stop_codon:yes gene_type:complete